MIDYEAEYKVLKASRRLVWRRMLGTVEIELAFANGTREFSVSPLLASVIGLFQEQGNNSNIYINIYTNVCI